MAKRIKRKQHCDGDLTVEMLRCFPCVSTTLLGCFDDPKDQPIGRPYLTARPKLTVIFNVQLCHTKRRYLKAYLPCVRHSFRFIAISASLFDGRTEQRWSRSAALTFHSKMQHVEKRNPAHCVIMTKNPPRPPCFFSFYIGFLSDQSQLRKKRRLQVVPRSLNDPTYHISPSSALFLPLSWAFIEAIMNNVRGN